MACVVTPCREWWMGRKTGLSASQRTHTQTHTHNSCHTHTHTHTNPHFPLLPSSGRWHTNTHTHARTHTNTRTKASPSSSSCHTPRFIRFVSVELLVLVITLPCCHVALSLARRPLYISASSRSKLSMKLWRSLVSPSLALGAVVTAAAAAAETVMPAVLSSSSLVFKLFPREGSLPQSESSMPLSLTPSFSPVR